MQVRKECLLKRSRVCWTRESGVTGREVGGRESRRQGRSIRGHPAEEEAAGRGGRMAVGTWIEFE